MKKSLFNFVMAGVCFSIISGVKAGEQSSVPVDIRVNSTSLSSGIFSHFRLADSQYFNRPTCSSGDWWAINTDTTVGKNWLALLMMANATGKKVYVLGLATCAMNSGMEDVKQIGIVP